MSDCPGYGTFGADQRPEPRSPRSRRARRPRPRVQGRIAKLAPMRCCPKRALVREAGQAPFRGHFAGSAIGAGAAQRKIAEMRPVRARPGRNAAQHLNSLAGNGVHLVTVNDTSLSVTPTGLGSDLPYARAHVRRQPVQMEHAGSSRLRGRHTYGTNTNSFRLLATTGSVCSARAARPAFRSSTR